MLYSTSSLRTSISLRRLSEQEMLNEAAINTIMSEEKPNQIEKIHITYSKIRQYIPRSVPLNQAEDYITKALCFYHNYSRKSHLH